MGFLETRWVIALAVPSTAPSSTPQADARRGAIELCLHETQASAPPDPNKRERERGQDITDSPDQSSSMVWKLTTDSL